MPSLPPPHAGIRSPEAHMQDQEEFGRVVRFIGLDPESRALLRGFWPLVEAELPAILEAFYQHATAEPDLKRMLGDRVPRLKQAQTEHWRRLFSSTFDAA